MNNPIEEGQPFASNDSKWTKIQMGLLCGMLLLALIGMALTQATEKGAWEYWLVVVLIYAGVGAWQSKQRAKFERPFRASISRQLLHWAVVLVFMAALTLLEAQEIITRQAASDFALMMLAMSCCMAGIHFDRLMMVVGIVLTAMAVALATIQQYSLVLWLGMVAVAVAAATYFFFRPKGSDPDTRPREKAS